MKWEDVSVLFVGQMVPMPNDVCTVPSWQWLCLCCLLDRWLMLFVLSPAGSGCVCAVCWTDGSHA